MKDFQTAELFITKLYMHFGTFFFLVGLGKLPQPDAFINGQPVWEDENTRGFVPQWYMQPFKPLPALLDTVQEAGSASAEGKRHPGDVSFKGFSVLLSALKKGKTLAEGRYVADVFDLLLNELQPDPDYWEKGVPFWRAGTVADYIVQIGKLLGFRVEREGVLAGLVRVEYVVQL